MRTVLGILISGILAFSATATSFVHGPYSGAPSEDSVTISWESDTALPARIEYGSLEYFEARRVSYYEECLAPLESGEAVRLRR